MAVCFPDRPEFRKSWALGKTASARTVTTGGSRGCRRFGPSGPLPCRLTPPLISKESAFNALDTCGTARDGTARDARDGSRALRAALTTDDHRRRKRGKTLTGTTRLCGGGTLATGHTHRTAEAFIRSCRPTMCAVIFRVRAARVRTGLYWHSSCQINDTSSGWPQRQTNLEREPGTSNDHAAHRQAHVRALAAVYCYFRWRLKREAASLSSRCSRPSSTSEAAFRCSAPSWQAATRVRSSADACHWDAHRNEGQTVTEGGTR